MAMTLRLTDELDQGLTDIAKTLGVSKNTLAVNAIAKYIAQETQRAVVKEAFTLVSKRDAKLLERLEG